jgi:hypothetical protein
MHEQLVMVKRLPPFGILKGYEMLKSVKRATFVVAAAATAVAIGAATAQAGPPFTVTAGTTTTGSTTFTGTATGTSSAPAIIFKDVTDNVTLTCVSSVAKGSVALGSGKVNPLAQITSSTWTTCSGPLGISLTVAQVGAWGINGTSGPTGGVVSGFASNVKANISGTCSFTVGGPGSATAVGTADITYTNPVGTTPGKLAAAPVTGSGHALAIHTGGATVCFGLIHDNAVATFSTSTPYVTTTPLGNLTIS